MGLVFSSPAAHVGHVGDMDKNGIAAPAFEGEFADGLEKRQAFNVASGAADLGDHHISAALFSHFLNALFDFIGHVRNHLHGFAE